jgi:hypothetical protein
MQIFLTNSKKNAKTNPSYQEFSSPRKEKEPPRDSAPLPSIRQEINHITIERENEFSQVGRKFQPSILLHMGEL